MMTGSEHDVVSENWFKKLVAVGGPESHEYALLNGWFARAYKARKAGALTTEQLRASWDLMGEAASVKTLQGFVMRRPHGYAGDFEIIDKIYNHWVTPEVELMKWDLYFHAQAAPQAVRNRKAYFLNLLAELESTATRRLRVLNVASGPCRDLYEFFSQKCFSEINMDFVCVDLDENAIDYAKRLCEPNLQNIEFVQANVFRYRPSVKTYDLVWCAGLFDYLDEKAFKLVFLKLLSAVRPGGQLVVGNFSDTNPTRPYMEFADWCLHHRSAEKLELLALACGVQQNNLEVRQESTGINLFVHATVG